MICGNCGREIEVYFKCELTGRIMCENCEKAVTQTPNGPKMKYPCYYKEDHEHVRTPRLNQDDKSIPKGD